MHKSATKCNETIGKWCKNKHGASKIIDTFETYQFPTFDLEKDGVTVKITAWNGDVKPIGELSDVWVTVRGIPPKWCAWKTFGQLASVFEILMDVDWAAMFRSFYVEVKLLIACKDSSKIPL
jgi:hypothetical protein